MISPRLLIATLLFLLPATAFAQVGPGTFSEPVVTIHPLEGDVQLNEIQSTPIGDESLDVSTYAIDASELPSPLWQDEIDQLQSIVQGAVVPIRATIQRDPLMFPPTIEIDAVATLIELENGDEIFITASFPIAGAQLVEFIDASGRVPATVFGDARYGLAVLIPQRDLSSLPLALPVLPVTAEIAMEGYSGGAFPVGATMGAGDEIYGYYQLNTLQVTAGYPVVNQQGELIGIGSHLYPPNPVLSLSISTASVLEFLELGESGR